MKTFKVSELIIGCVYQCQLSGLRLLIEQIPTQTVETMQGTQVTKWDIGAMYFNPVTGSYAHMKPVDNQLIELE